MAAAPGFLEFFILEASDYIEQLDALLGKSSSIGPDGDAMQRAARALRGTATMAKLPAFAELAGSVERVGRAIHERALTWEPALNGAVVSAIDELKTLLHAARTWSDAEDRRARERASELARFAPPRATPVSNAAVPGGSSTFFSTESANIAAGLELLTARGGDQETAGNVLRRVRALRGVAGIKEIGPLSDALEATEDAARGLELGHEKLTPEARRLLEAAASFLRSLSVALRAGGDVNAASAARDEFEAARSAVDASTANRDRIIPIARLFYEEGPGLMEASQHPPTTAAERFRLELVSLGEHLRQVVAAARSIDGVGSPRARRDITRALLALESAADSFGEREVAEFVRSHTRSENAIDASALNALDDLAGVLAEPGSQGERLRARLRDLTGGKKDVAAGIGAGFGRSTPPVTRTPPVTPAVLDTSIAALEAFSASRSATPTAVEETSEVVPIESLLYRGRAALDRAVELRNTLRRADVLPDPDELEELYDLLELARNE